MPEVKFVEKFIEASIEIAKGQELERRIDSADDEGKKDWTPLGPFESVTLSTGSDYGINRTKVANIIGTLVKRAQIIVNWNLKHEEELSNNTIRVVGSGADKGGKVVDKETTGSKLLESLGILEGQNILHEVIDQKILESIKEIAKKTDINNILKTNDDISNLNGISNKKPLDLYKNSETTINFTHSGENNEYKYFNENNINSAFKIEDSFIFETSQTLKEEVENIKETASKGGFISWVSSLFGNDINVEITNENKIIYKDNDTNSKSFWFDKDISLFSFPPLKNFNKISDADKIKNYSDTILRPLFIDGTYIPTIPIGLSKKFNTPNNIAENFLSVLINVGLTITTGTGLDKEFLYETNANLFLHLETFINKRKLLLPGIIEVPYINLVYWGWYLSILDDNISTDFNATIINKTAVDYLKNLPKIVKDQFIDKFNDFKNRLFPLIKEKIIKDINSTILELNFIQFQQDINNIKDWGKPKQDIKPENAWWFELTKRNYIFLGLPLLLKNPKKIKEEKDILDLNPESRRNNVSFLIKSTLKFLNEKIDDKIKDIKKIEKEIENQLKDPDLKLSLYNSFKSINDRWLSGGFSPFNNKSGIDKLISKFSFVDRGMRDIGVTPKDNGKINFNRFNNPGDVGDEKSKSVIINFTSVENTIENNSMSLLTLISLLLTDNGFEFFPLQNFMLFDSENDSNSWNIKNTFGINQNIQKDHSPKFLCLYIDSKSSFFDVGKGDIFENDGAEISDIISEGGKINAFSVKYGDPNQSMFKDISLDQAEFKETIESIKILDKISQIGSEDVDAKTILKGQNLFNTYEQRSYSCEVEMLGNAMIQPTQYFNLENIPMFHGAYMIIQVNHSIVPNNMTTKFKGVRIPKNSLPLVTDYAAAVGFDLCTDSSVEGNESGKGISSDQVGVIDINKINNSNNLYIQHGELFYIIDHKIGVAGNKLLEFMKDLQEFLGNLAILENNGITRDLESVVAGGPSRSKTSKHGAGLAIDLLISTKDVDYKKLGWPAANKELVKDKNLMIQINKFVLTDSRYKNLIRWGGHFKLGKHEQITDSLSVRINEIHHFEIKDEKIEQFFNDSIKNKMKKLGINTPTKQKDLALLYSYPFDPKPFSKEKFNQQILDSDTGEDGTGDEIDHNRS